MSRTQRRCAARIAVLAVVLNALAPTVTQVRNAWFGETRLPEALRVAYGLEQADSRLDGPAPAEDHGPAHGHHFANAGDSVANTGDIDTPCHPGPECAYCVTHAGSHGLAAVDAMPGAPAKTAARPRAPPSTASPAPDHWHPARPRSPPVFS